MNDVLLGVLVVLAILVVIAIVAALVVLSRRRSVVGSSASVASTAAPPRSLPGSAPQFEAPSASEAPAATPEPAAVDPWGAPVPTASPEGNPAPESGPVIAAASPPDAVAVASEEVPSDPANGQDAPAAPPEDAGVPAPEPEEATDRGPEGFGARDLAEANSSTPGDESEPSPNQTPSDIDERSPAELAAAAQAAGDEQEVGETAPPDADARPLEVAIGPPRPVALAAIAAPDPARLRLLGLTLGMLTERMRQESAPQLGTALARLVDGDQAAARSQLTTLALSLLGEDQEPGGGDGQLSLFLEEALQGEVRRGFSFSTMPEFQQALGAIAPELREKLQTIVWAHNADSIAILTTDDVETLERVAVAMSTALMLDRSYDVRQSPQTPER